MQDIWTRIKIVLRAAPTWLATASLVLTVVGVELLPLLPENVAVQAAGFITVALAWIAAIVRVIQRVMPAPPEVAGTLVPSERYTVKVHPLNRLPDR